MKKIAAFFLNMMLVFSLSACGTTITPDDDAPVVTPPASSCVLGGSEESNSRVALKQETGGSQAG